MNKQPKLIDVALTLSVFSFLIGSFIFLLLIQTHFEAVITFAMLYLVLAFLANTVVWLLLLFRFIAHNEAKAEVLKMLLLMPCNLPIAYCYFMIAAKYYV